MALAHSIRDFSDNHEELEDGFYDTITYSVKYLGNTSIPTPRTESSTADAVKRIIAAAKGNKKLQRVTLSISPKGIEMLDLTTGESLLQVSIYNISYCSADAAHDHVFAFVGTTSSPEMEVKEMCFRKDAEEVDFEGPLVCYAFLCQKRKMAQTVTLTVARSFERAYQIWQNKQFHAERKRKELEKQSCLNGPQSSSKIKPVPNESNPPQSSCATDDKCDNRNLLIDFSSELTAEICSKDHRDLLQNTWVSFDDDQSPQEFFAVPNLTNANGWSRTAICSN